MLLLQNITPIQNRMVSTGKTGAQEGVTYQPPVFNRVIHKQKCNKILHILSHFIDRQIFMRGFHCGFEHKKQQKQNNKKHIYINKLNSTKSIILIFVCLARSGGKSG